METNIERKPVKHGAKNKRLKIQIHTYLTPELKEWVDQHPEGHSALIRRLLLAERARVEGTKP